MLGDRAARRRRGLAARRGPKTAGTRCGNCNGARPGSANGFVAAAQRPSRAVCSTDRARRSTCSAARSSARASRPPPWRSSPRSRSAARCSRVSLGFLEGTPSPSRSSRTRAQFGQQMNLVSCLGAAMDEALDQRSVILYPRPADQAHRRRRPMPSCPRSQRDGQILTVPLLVGDRFVGASPSSARRTCRSSRRPSSCSNSSPSVVGPVLEEKRQNDRWLIIKVAEAARQPVSGCSGRAIWRASSSLAAIAGAVLFLSFAHEHLSGRRRRPDRRPGAARRGRAL